MSVIGTTGVEMSWTDNANNENDFEIQKFLEGDQWRGGGTAPANTESTPRTGLEANERYKFRVRARNANGSSVWEETPDWIDLSIVGRFSTSGLVNQSMKFRAYPSPMTQSLLVEGVTDILSLSVIDVFGNNRMLKGRELSNGKIEIDTHDYQSGVYIILNNETNASIKVIKL